jgi:hypothetical protein
MTDDGRHIAAMFELSAGKQQLLIRYIYCVALALLVIALTAIQHLIAKLYRRYVCNTVLQ